MSLAAVKALTTQCVDRPAHAAAVAGLRQRHRSYAGAVRLMLRWLGSAMFGDAVSHEAVELLVAVSVLFHCPAGLGCVEGSA